MFNFFFFLTFHKLCHISFRTSPPKGFFHIHIPFVILKRILRWLLCTSSKNINFNFYFVRTQTLFLKQKKSSIPNTKFLALSTLIKSIIFFKLSSNNCLSFIIFKKSLIIVSWLQMIWFLHNFIPRFISLKCSMNSSSYTIIINSCAFLKLKESTTTLAFPGW